MNSLSLSKLLTQFEKKIHNILGTEWKTLQEINAYAIASGGKRIRPILHYCVADCLGPIDERNIRVGAVLEIIHTASLLHDDVVDESSERRGRPTIAKVWTNKHAILAGDYFLACGLDAINELRSPVVLDTFTKVIRELSISEILQMDWQQNPKITEEIYNRIIFGKTSALFGACTYLAYVLSEKNPESRESNQFWKFGIDLGNYFQRRDDYMDYFFSKKDLGKDPWKDFDNGLYTYPIFELRKILPKKSSKLIDSCFQSPKNNRKNLEKIFEDCNLEDSLKQNLKRDYARLESFLLTLKETPSRNLVFSQLEKLKL